MSEKRFEIKADDVDSSIINITRDGEDFAWFLSDDITDKQVEKVCDLLNEQQATINNFEKLFSETIGVADTSKLLETGDYEIKRMVVKELIENLQKENEQLRQKLDFYLLDEFEWKEKYGD